ELRRPACGRADGGGGCGGEGVQTGGGRGGARVEGGWMLKRVAIVLAACGGGGQKPVENVVKAPAYSCETAVDAILKPHPLGNGTDHARADLVASCSHAHRPDAFLACTTAGAQSCDDTRAIAQEA